VILTIILILRPTDPENNLVVVDLENFFCGIFFSNHHLKFSTCFLEFFLHFFSALFETDIYTRAMIFNSYYGRCFLKGFFFANFCFCFIEEFESSKVLRTMFFFEGGKVEKRPNGFSLFCM